MAPKNENPLEDLWKERLAFTSGTILIWGYSLLQLWPLAANFQTSRNIHIWTLISELFREGEIQPEDQSFFLIVLLLNLGIWTVLFAILHILTRGLWLTRGAGEAGSENERGEKLASISEFAFGYLFALNAFGITLTGIAIVTYVCDAALRYVLTGYLGPRAQGWLIPFVIGGLLGVLVVLPRSRAVAVKMLQGLKPLVPRFHLTFAFVLFFWVFIFSNMVLIEMTYTVDLSIDKQVVSKSQHQVLDVSVRLGGATSPPHLASLAIYGPRNEFIRQLQLEDLGDGLFISRVPVEGLQNGVHEARLQYPHLALGRSKTLVRNVVEKRKRFLIAD